MIDAKLWRRANTQLAAKIIGECTYEECLQPQPLACGDYELRLASDICYRFRARETVWGWLRVDPLSLRRDAESVSSAVQLLIDARQELGVSDITLGGLIEEIQNTLYSEVMRQQRLEGWWAEALLALPGPRLQALLDGHPKALANKGRLGWGERELHAYAPEADNAFALRYVALHRDCCHVVLAQTVSPASLLAQSVEGDFLETVRWRLEERGVSPDDYLVVPVHPWQFQRFIAIQYAQQLACGELIDLGSGGDLYLPQQSIRTLSNVSRPGFCDIKLSLTILNTSCYRGIPAAPLAAGVSVSAWLKQLVASDALLAERGLTVLAELAGVHLPQPYQAQVAGSPYRYQEMLGAVWRESIESKLAEGEQGLLMSTLMQTDCEGRALIAELVAQSGLPVAQWLRELFDVVVVPLYHLMCGYGVGLVAHGQNVSLIVNAGRPQRAVIKDFHGDLRLVDRELPELESLPAQARAALTRLPPEHLLHDLVSGHFVTTLRFISPLVEEQLGLEEREFYAILADSLRDYMSGQPQLEERFDWFPLLSDTLLKVCVNRVRFRIGYGDSDQRPLPELGSPIANPLI